MTPAPALMTNPSRSSSNGRDASSGSSLRVDNARALPLPAKSPRVRQLSAPPAITTSAKPNWIQRAASPSESVPVAQAVLCARLGPRAPNCMLISPAALSIAPAICANGLTDRGPLSRKVSATPWL